MMKKIIAMILVVLTLSLSVAQAEVKLKGTGWDYKKGNYVVLESETGETAKLYVTEEEMYEYIAWDFKKAEQEALNQTWWGRLMFWK